METAYGKHWVIRNAKGEYYGHRVGPEGVVAGFAPDKRRARKYAKFSETALVIANHPGARAVSTYPTFDYMPSLSVVKVEDFTKRPINAPTPELTRYRLFEITDHFSAEGDFTPFWALACLALPGEGEADELAAALAWLRDANNWLSARETADEILNRQEDVSGPKR